MKKSAGLLLFRQLSGTPEVLLVHPGGPFWKNKDDGAWSIPKGEFNDDEQPLEAAIRECREETGIACSGTFIELTPVKQKSGKLVFAWAIEQDADVSAIKSNEFRMEWPRGSGRFQSVPEVDRAGWFGLSAAARKILPGQLPLVRELAAVMAWDF